MSTTGTCLAGCPCKNLYTDWVVGQRSGICEDCGHLKTGHSRELVHPSMINISNIRMKGFCIVDFI